MTVTESLRGATPPDDGEVPQSGNAASTRFAARAAMTRCSALWAAYGDALGWISELTDSKGLKRRTRGEALCRPIAWNRRIGGRGGITASLPVGCYSDDSQLRLATGRAIGPSGFDVEAFAKVELPVWLSYGLGGGRSTSAAAANLSRRTVPWFANTFKGWGNSGGNGAAMRVQPRVWASRDLDDARSYLTDVVRNTICTHSHPRGLLGSVVHALTLAQTMATGRQPSVSEVMGLVKTAAELPEFIRNDIEVGNYWRGAFERELGSFDDAWVRAIEECMEAVSVAGASVRSVNGAERYATLIQALRLREPARRGCGMLTAVASVGLLWCESEPERAIRIAANELGTDTDTIASMAGAIVGAVAATEPQVQVLDAELFRSEANRLVRVAFGGHPDGHRYPDLLRWSAPSSRADTLVRTRNKGLYVRGLGQAKETSDPMSSPNGDFQWQWLTLETGQTLLIKRRAHLLLIEDEIETFPTQQSLLPLPSGVAAGQVPLIADRLPTGSDCPGDAPLEAKNTTSRSGSSLDLDAALHFVEQRIDDDKAVGTALRRVVNKGTPGQIAAFTSALIDHLREPTR